MPDDKKEKLLRELKLGYLNLSDGLFDEAQMCFDVALCFDENCAEAFWGKMLAKLQVKEEDFLNSQANDFKLATQLVECEKALKLASEEQKKVYENLLAQINKINQGENY